MKLKIELKLDDKTISGRVLEQDENLRKTANDEDLKLIISNTDFSILSCFGPELLSKRLYVRGMDDHADDDKWDRRYFAKYEDEKVHAYMDGCTSKTTDATLSWKYAKLAEED